MKRFLRDNGLSLVLLILFLTCWAAQALAGFHVFNEDLRVHGEASIPFGAYMKSGHFWQATGENRESEFLQMGFYVILTTRLFQRGSAESNDPDDAGKLSTKRRQKRGTWLYRNSLSLAFIGLFLVTFTLHAAGGLVDANSQRREHGEPRLSAVDFLQDSEFWFQSFQNWQSEFLAVLAIVVLSIFLRQDGSPEGRTWRILTQRLAHAPSATREASDPTQFGQGRLSTSAHRKPKRPPGL